MDRTHSRFRRTLPTDRHGSIVAWTAVVLTAVLGFTALAVDVGFMTQTKAQMQSAADGAVLSAALEMPNGWGAGKTSTASQVDVAARAAAQAVAVKYRVGEQAAAYLDTTRDIRFGQRTKSSSGAWVESWGTSPYNMMEITIRRDQPLSGTTATRGDQQLPLFFAKAMGNQSASMIASATAVLAPGNGFYIPPSSGLTCPVLPLAIDQTTWNDLINNGVGTDSYKYNSNGTVSTGTDGIKEVSLYPSGSSSLPSGNRGTVDIGSANNSTADLSRQIRYGPNQADLAYFGGKLQIPASGVLLLNGDTGLSAGIKDDLAAIIGQPRAIPVFSAVSGPGNNATFQITKFVGVRIMFVQLTGSPSNKKVVVQPAPVFDGTIIGSPGSAMQPDSIMTSLKIIH
ncbi:MAG: pilus assembly protein TadG-related protein [Planctomycetaceae bacterium]